MSPGRDAVTSQATESGTNGLLHRFVPRYPQVPSLASVQQITRATRREGRVEQADAALARPSSRPVAQAAVPPTPIWTGDTEPDCLSVADDDAEERFVLRCAWCGRFAVGDRWLDAAWASSALDLDSAYPPLVSHGLCADCDASLIAEEAQQD